MDPPTGESVGCNRRTLRGRELSPAQLRHWEWPASPPSGGFVRRVLTRLAVVAVVLCPPAVAGQSPTPPPARPATDLDGFMAKALQRRDIDRKTLSDYVLDEVEEFEVLGPGRVPFVRMRREYTWYVRDGFHVRSPLKFDGVPIPEDARRAYEDRWLKSEEGRRKFRTEREAKRAAEGKGPALSAPSINEPRFISESYFMDFKFEPGNYYLAGKEVVEGTPVLKVDYLPTHLFDDDEASNEDKAIREKQEQAKEPPKPEKPKTEKEVEKERQQHEKEKKLEDEIERKMDKTSQVTLWVDPSSSQIVKYTFNNVWLDFLPVGWLVRVDDLRANMQMGQPFPGVWLPKNMNIHAGISLALGPMEFQYKREFSNYRKADVSSKITVPKRVQR
jgi:hypothetical protein